MQNLVDVGRREGGLRREGISRYFFCSIYPFLYSCSRLQATGHTSRPITTVYGSKRVFLCKVSHFVGFDVKK